MDAKGVHVHYTLPFRPLRRLATPFFEQAGRVGRGSGDCEVRTDNTNAPWIVRSFDRAIPPLHKIRSQELFFLLTALVYCGYKKKD
jgi:hypothetical protein